MYVITNGSTPTIMFLLTDATDNETAETGLTVSSIDVYVSKNGGAFAAATNEPAEVGRGWYSVALTATETNTDGPLVVEAVYTGTSNIWRWMAQVVTTLPASLSATVRNQIADNVLRRNFTTSLASSDGDTVSEHCLMIYELLQGNWRLKAGDDTIIEILSPAGSALYEKDVTYAVSGSTGATQVV